MWTKKVRKGKKTKENISRKVNHLRTPAGCHSAPSLGQNRVVTYTEGDHYDGQAENRV